MNLNVPDPDAHARQFGGVSIDLDAQHRIRADQRQRRVQAKHLRVDADAEFMVFQREQ